MASAKNHLEEDFLINSSSAHSPARFSEGFTLIEIMVVVLIIAVLATFFVSSFSSNLDRSARLESQRFMAVVNEVRDESIIAGEIFIMSLNEKAQTYGFSSPRTNRSVAQDSGLLKTRRIEQTVKVDWDVFEQFEDDNDNNKDEPDLEPRVLISPLGEITPFDLRFKGEQVDYHVFVNDENQLEQDTKRSLK